MYKKFGKDRSVSPNWLHVPVKYMTEVNGSLTQSQSRYELTDEYVSKRYEDYVKFMNEIDIEPITVEEFKQSLLEDGDCGEYIPPKNDKDFCIVELHKHSAVCAWRNNQTCKIGMSFKCKVETKKDGTIGIVYKDKFYPINKSSSGWVI